VGILWQNPKSLEVEGKPPIRGGKGVWGQNHMCLVKITHF